MPPWSTTAWLKPRSLFLTTERIGCGNDRLVDNQPAGTGYTGLGTVLGRDITRPIEIGMQREATHLTHKQVARAAVVAGGMPASAACLRGMSRVNRNHRTTPFLSLIHNEALQLGERPAVNTALRLGV